MKCTTCDIICDYDESEQCLHCWCISNNIECECSCIDNDSY